MAPEESKIRIEIFEKAEEEKKVVVRLKLEANNRGGVSLIAVDERGNMVLTGNILKIRADGTLFKYSAMDVPGLQTDGGVIKESD